MFRDFVSITQTQTQSTNTNTKHKIQTQNTNTNTKYTLNLLPNQASSCLLPCPPLQCQIQNLNTKHKDKYKIQTQQTAKSGFSSFVAVRSNALYYTAPQTIVSTELTFMRENKIF